MEIAIALLAFAGAFVGVLFARYLSRDQSQRDAVIRLVEAALAYRRALVAGLAARSYDESSEGTFRLAASELKARAVLVIDKALREEGKTFHDLGWGAANVRGFGAFPNKPVDTDKVWAAFDAMCERVPGVLKKLA